MTIYLDYAATTPVDPRVAAAMAECLTNPAAQAQPGFGHAWPGTRRQRSRGSRCAPKSPR